MGRRSCHATDEHMDRMRALVPRRSPEERFWEKVDKNGPGGCWVWNRPVRHRPQVYVKGKPVYAYRLVFEMIGRGKVPDDMFVDHICRNGMCCNPDHLRIVTPKVNGTENSVSPMAQYAQATHCIYGHELAGANLALYKPKRRKSRHGKWRTDVPPTRVCLTCRPWYWRWAVIPRDPPPNAKRRKADVPRMCGGKTC